MGSMVEFTRPDGQNAPGYYAEAAANAPGIVLIEEWWGVDERFKATADRLASHNFNVLVPDLFRGRTAAVGNEANHLMEGLDFGDAATQDVVGASRYLRERGARRVGVMGFCMGGALAMLSVMHGNSFDAVSTWYGAPPPETGDPAKISVPIQGHWARQDTFATPQTVAEIERKLKAAEKQPEFYSYDAEHGFYNTGEPGDAGLGHYDREAAEAAWRRTVEFFDRTLRD
ncbi:MAG: dienelactone hydrolase family protein [Candidatus Eremiobacteraeota bacterium]|nr:dienelactone hydrolase family protein [Candidatus Eremiobacteraeota bacterium]